MCLQNADLQPVDTCVLWTGLCGCTATANPAYRTEGSESILMRKKKEKKAEPTDNRTESMLGQMDRLEKYTIVILIRYLSSRQE